MAKTKENKVKDTIIKEYFLSLANGYFDYDSNGETFMEDSFKLLIIAKDGHSYEFTITSKQDPVEVMIE